MLGDRQGKKLKNYVSDYVVFDLETTGISPYNDEVVEISAVKVQESRVVDKFTTLVNPGRAIPYGASSVNGITDEMVMDAPDFKAALADFFAFVGDMPLVGHNIQNFDMKFIYRDSMKFFGKLPDNDYIDTLFIAKQCLPRLRHHRLTDLAEYYGLSTDGAHRALNDCIMNQQVYENMIHGVSDAELKKRGVRICPACGNIMKKRSGIYGEFWGCGGYPECRHTERV